MIEEELTHNVALISVVQHRNSTTLWVVTLQPHCKCSCHLSPHNTIATPSTIFPVLGSFQLFLKIDSNSIFSFLWELLISYTTLLVPLRCCSRQPLGCALPPYLNFWSQWFSSSSCWSCPITKSSKNLPQLLVSQPPLRSPVVSDLSQWIITILLSGFLTGQEAPQEQEPVKSHLPQWGVTWKPTFLFTFCPGECCQLPLELTHRFSEALSQKASPGLSRPMTWILDTYMVVDDSELIPPNLIPSLLTCIPKLSTICSPPDLHLFSSGMWSLCFWVFFFFLRFYLFERESKREHEWGRGEGQREKQTLSWARTHHGAWSQDTEIMTRAEGRYLTNWLMQVPLFLGILTLHIHSPVKTEIIQSENFLSITRPSNPIE